MIHQVTVGKGGLSWVSQLLQICGIYLIYMFRHSQTDHICLSSLLYHQWKEAGTSFKSALSHPDVNRLHHVERSLTRKDGYYSSKKML